MFRGFHGSFLGHSMKEILNLTTPNVQRGLDGFKSVQLIPV